jgi:hypothetical protein
MIRDPDWGLTLAVGLGGVWVDGCARHADLDKLAEIITRIAGLAERLGPQLESLEINPLLVNGSQIEALDALITWR